VPNGPSRTWPTSSASSWPTTWRSTPSRRRSTRPAVPRHRGASARRAAAGRVAPGGDARRRARPGAAPAAAEVEKCGLPRQLEPIAAGGEIAIAVQAKGGELVIRFRTRFAPPATTTQATRWRSPTSASAFSWHFDAEASMQSRIDGHRLRSDHPAALHHRTPMTLADARIPRVLIADDEAPARSRLRDLSTTAAPTSRSPSSTRRKSGREVLDIVSREKVDICAARHPHARNGRHGVGAPSRGHGAPAGSHLHHRLRRVRDQAFEVNAIRLPAQAIRAERLSRHCARSSRRRRAGRRSRQRERAAQAPERPRARQNPPRARAEILYLRAELKYVTCAPRPGSTSWTNPSCGWRRNSRGCSCGVHRNCLVARAAVEGVERQAQESESGWAVVIRGTGERLPVSRRQQHVVKEFR